MNREQKAAVIEEIAAQITASEAVFAVDYRGITVEQAAELRMKLRDADASLRVVKNTLTIRAADQRTAIARLPSRDVLNAHFVNIVASPLTGLVTSLSNLISGFARQLAQIAEQKEAGEIPGGDAPVSVASAAA